MRTWLAIVACLATGCGYPVGLVYSSAQTPHGQNRTETAGHTKPSDKQGEACVTGILYLVAFGDGSLDAAKKAGGITDVHTVELHTTNILGIYSQGCTEVHGR